MIPAQSASFSQVVVCAAHDVPMHSPQVCGPGAGGGCSPGASGSAASTHASKVGTSHAVLLAFAMHFEAAAISVAGCFAVSLAHLVGSSAFWPQVVNQSLIEAQ